MQPKEIVNLYNTSLPAKAAFFCPNCVDDIYIKLEPEGNPMNCRECGNNRIITPHDSIVELTPNWCKVDGFFSVDIKGGSYYVIIIPSLNWYDNIYTDFADSISSVKGARYLKDRFFFSSPLEEEFLNKHFYTQLAWIPKT